jgi:hypothetical protein
MDERARVREILREVHVEHFGTDRPLSEIGPWPRDEEFRARFRRCLEESVRRLREMIERQDGRERPTRPHA